MGHILQPSLYISLDVLQLPLNCNLPLQKDLLFYNLNREKNNVSYRKRCHQCLTQIDAGFCGPSGSFHEIFFIFQYLTVCSVTCVIKQTDWNYLAVLNQPRRSNWSAKLKKREGTGKLATTLNNVLQFLGLVLVTDVAAESQNFSSKKITGRCVLL